MAALLLERCVAQHRTALNSPFCAPHVNSWLELFAAAGARVRAPLSPSPLGSAASALSIFPVDALEGVANVWRENARAYRLHQLIDRAVKPKDGGRGTGAWDDPRITGQGTEEERVDGKSWRLSAQETLITLWAVQMALATLSALATSKPHDAAGSAVLLPFEQVQNGLRVWLEERVSPLLDFFFFATSDTVTHGREEFLSLPSCLRVLHASLLYIALSFREAEEQHQQQRSGERVNGGADQRHRGTTASSFAPGGCEGSWGRGMAEMFASASSMLLASDAAAEAAAVGVVDTREFHQQLHERLQGLAEGNSDDSKDNAPSATAKGEEEMGFPAALEKALHRLLLLQQGKGEGRTSASLEASPLRCPFPLSPLGENQTVDMLDMLDEQLSAIALSGGGGGRH